MSESSQPAPAGAGPEKPGRYQRSTGGLIGSMILLVVAVLGFVVFRAVFRDPPQYEPDHIDYRALVTSVQQTGLRPVYPPELPAGWFAKDASFSPGDRPSLDLVFTTSDEHTVGLHQEDAAATGMVKDLVGDAATEADTTLTTPVGTWEGWQDTDGDHAWTTEVGEETVLAYGTGSARQLREFVQSLSTEQLTP